MKIPTWLNTLVYALLMINLTALYYGGEYRYINAFAAVIAGMILFLGAELR